MNIKEQIRAIVGNDSLNDLEKIQSLRALIPPEVRSYSFDNVMFLSIDQMEALEQALEVCGAALRISKKLVADKIQEN